MKGFTKRGAQALIGDVAVLFVVVVLVATPVVALAIMDGPAGKASCSFVGSNPCGLCDIVMMAGNTFHLFFDFILRAGILAIIGSVFIILSKKFKDDWIEIAENTIKWSVMIILIATTVWLIISTIFYFISDPEFREWGKLDCSRFITDSVPENIDQKNKVYVGKY